MELVNTKLTPCYGSKRPSTEAGPDNTKLLKLRWFIDNDLEIELSR